MKPRIVISNYDHIDNPHYGGGGAIAVENLIERLKSKYNFTLITGNYYSIGNQKKSVYFQKKIGLKNFGPKIGQLTYCLLLPIYALMTKHDLWIECFTPPFTTSFLPLFTKKNVIGVTHFFDAEEKAKEYRIPFHLIERIGVKFYKYIIALTQERKSKAERLNPNAIVEIIPNGVNLIPLKKVNKKPNSYFLFLGRVEIFQKGLDMLIKTFSNICKSYKVNLIIAGPGIKRDLDELDKLIKKHNLAGRVSVVGKVTGRKKVELLRNSIALVVPSRFEGQSLSVLESLTQGTPIICFEIPGLVWLSKATALKAKPFSLKAFGKHLENILIRRSLRSQLARECLKEAKHYSWNSVAKQYDVLIQKAILEKNQ